MKKKKNTSLILLNTNALKAAFNVPTRVTQKLIKKNDVNPINSQPKNIIIKLPELTRKTILKTKDDKNKIKRSTNGS